MDKEKCKCGNETFQILQEVYKVIEDRRKNPKEGSYTNYLFDKGIDKMLKKVGEETAEVIIASKNNSKEEIVYEISDLLYHLMVVMVQTDIQWEDICNELKKRR
ncbi:MAG: phosphoribosyl-ATP diphosphatase [Epulopiscium sp.]|nr:phosphoribosyl-ATP diphosphatase [Candidatus Epulonipiscium sp.]